MGFMQSYKRLDGLCRDMNGVGITGYLRDMEHAHKGAFYVRDWNDDYRQLKHYRYLRNRIAHESDVTEESVTLPEDAQWLEEFYQRILCQTDPLAEYCREMRRRQAPPTAAGKRKEPTVEQRHFHAQPEPSRSGKKKFLAGCIVAVVFLLLCMWIAWHL